MTKNGDLGPAEMLPTENNGGEPSEVPPKPVQDTPGDDTAPVKTPAAEDNGGEPSEAPPKPAQDTPGDGTPGDGTAPEKTPAAETGGAQAPDKGPRIVLHFRPDRPKAAADGGEGTPAEPPRLVLHIQSSAPKKNPPPAAPTRRQPAKPFEGQSVPPGSQPDPAPAPAPAAENSGAKPRREALQSALADLRSKREKRERISLAARWRRMRPLERVALFVPAVVVVAVVIVVLAFTQKLMSFELEGRPCQYYGGNFYRLNSGTTLTRTSEGTTVLKSSGGTRPANDLPIYYEDRDALTTTQDMVYYDPRSGKHGRLEFFTELERESGGRVAVFHSGEELNLAPGFLYNGEDLYIFTEPVTLTFNGYKLELPALSYVEAVYNGDVMAFNYDTKECFMEPPRSEVLASVASGDYTVSLVNDSMTNYAGKRTLLFSRPELLDPVG